MKKEFILAALLASVCMVAQGAFVPVALTGFNEDIIANGSGPCANSVSAEFTNGVYAGIDNQNFALVAQDYIDPNGNSPVHYLPTGGVVTSAITPGLTFQLGDYSQNNTLFMPNNGDSSVLSFVTPINNVGSIYICGLAAQSFLYDNALFSVYVNFSDGTAQFFQYNFFYKWFDSTSMPISVPGIGRVYLPNGTTDSGATDINPHLLQLGLDLPDSDFNKTIISVGIVDWGIAGDANLAIMGVTVNTICAGMPTAGMITEDTTSCDGYSRQLSMTGTTAAADMTYQWQSSVDGTNFTDVAGATNASYTAPVSNNIYYRDSVSCAADSLWNITAPIEITWPFTIATLPYFQNFENWIGNCYNYDRPDSSFTLNPVTGNISWRRNDEGSDAGWDTPGSYGYIPASSSGSYSARFHSVVAANEAEGYMDLHVNLGAPGSKEISFDYVNGDGIDYMKVELSEDGGYTFTALDTIAENTFIWKRQHIAITSVATNAVIRFAANARKNTINMDDFTDIGIDSLAIFVQSACNGVPVDSIAASQVSGCAAYTSQLSLINDYNTGLAYQWDSSANGTDYTAIAGATNVTYTANVTENVFYRVRIVCTNSADTAYTAPVGLIITSPVASVATLPYFQSFENWIGTCYIYDRPDSNWLLNPVFSGDSWRKNNEGFDAGWSYSELGGYSPASSDGSYSARFHSSYTYQNSEGDMDLHIDLSQPGLKEISFDYINADGTDHLKVELSEDGLNFSQLAFIDTDTANWMPVHLYTGSMATNAIIRFAAISDYGNTDIGIDSLSIVDVPICNGTPPTGTFSNTNTSWCVPFVSYLQIDSPLNLSLNGIAYQWQSSADGVTFSDIPGATDISYNATVNTDTFYRFKTICTASLDTSFSPVTEFTVAPISQGIATLPYFQGFENWVSDCGSFDRPDSNWLNIPTTGNNSWRREDQGGYANWVYPISDGAYTPASTEGNHSARFSSYNASYGMEGDLELHVDLNAGSDKTLTFNYINVDGTDQLSVMLSLDSGVTFTTLATQHASAFGTWQRITVPLPYYSPDAILRFSAVSDFGYTDIGIDSLNITTLPCGNITGLSVSGISSNAAIATWIAIPSAIGYEALVDQSPSSPTGAGEGVGSNAYMMNNLQNNTTYYVHVRDSCGLNDFSAWTTTSFTTTDCDSITGLAVNNISDVGATISWNGVAGTAGYEYAITPAYTIPGAKTGTPATAFIKTNLAPNTTYYVFVRDSCGTGNYSGWDTVSFTTLLNVGVQDINGTFYINAYPSPTHNIITVQVYGIKGNGRKVSLTDLTGRLISTQVMATNKVDFDLANLPSGIYLIRYEDDERTKTIMVNKQ